MDLDNTTGSQTTENVDVINVGNVESLVLLCQIVLVVILCSTIWITISIVVYGSRKKKWNCKKKSGRIYIACFIPVPFAIMRHTIDIVRSFERDIPGAMERCEMLVDMSDCVFGIAIFTTYVFLWMKQRAIYAHPIMQPTNKRALNVFSWGLLIMVTCCSVAITSDFIIPANHSPGPLGCMEDEPNPGDWDAIKVFVLGGFTGFWQMGLLGLFIYPMIKNRSSLRRLTNSRISRTSLNQKTKCQVDRVMHTIKRSIIFAGIATLSDSISALVGMLAIPWSYPAIIKHTMYDFNLLVNLFCIVSTFGKNWQIFLLRCRVKNIRKLPSHTSSSSHENV